MNYFLYKQDYKIEINVAISKIVLKRNKKTFMF